ncbi:Methyltransferase domain-containing protein [Parafrankia irregularis]|uniref:Methyltransferase domain-containing protein n=1 Tax=Parafrankia irregularis TaxID=795642 RepID=A0A0S4QMY9_9ACTN|nr:MULTISPECIES: methyltransferase domain-containing protein [Parafrankia]MBE3201372.1 methyltransferase domain-containing protein [Parafrankia sp. CH37]CUU56172.1 Methyltransferase domain-containing protein [Parafrankia irregularis]
MREGRTGIGETTVHGLVADLVSGWNGGAVVDLGAGRGDTLVEIDARFAGAGVSLTAVDVDEGALAALSARLPAARVVRHDLSRPLPFADGAFDVAVSHNTLECLVEPAALLREVGRILRPGGRAVVAHTDFETIVVAIENRDLARRFLLTYAELPVLYANMAAADPWMGRRLAGLVRNSGLHLESVRAVTTVRTTLPEATELRLREVTEAVRRCAQAGRGRVAVEEIASWWEQLRAAEAAGTFFFSETAFVVMATRPGNLSGLSNGF